MPVVFRWKGYVFFFYSNEGTPREPIHVHVERGSESAKFWIEPDVSCDYSKGFTSSELNEIEKVLNRKKRKIVKRWNEFFKS
jgi:hypothetical protein